MSILCAPDQASGLVPIVEPEVLLDGEHDIDRTLEVAEAIWAETFKYMADQKARHALPCPQRLLCGL
jgi:fructose-bisphosphate aldolase class 1